MKALGSRLAFAGFIAAVLMFILKLWAGFQTGSLSIFADAINALLDIGGYFVLYLSVRIHHRAPDAGHPFGHRRAEPIAGLLLAVFAIALGIAILRDVILALASRDETAEAPLAWAIALLVCSILLKGWFAWQYRREHRRTDSVAAKAAYVDSRNDMAASLLALAGFTLGGAWDVIGGAAIAVWIIYTGVAIGLENVAPLMGAAPPQQVIDDIHTRAAAVPGVLGVHDIRAHHIGDVIHVELHIDVDRNLPLHEAHDLEMRVRETLERHPLVERAFIHLDPR